MAHLGSLAAMWADPETMRFVGAGKPWTEPEVRERLERAIAMHERTGMAFWVVRLIDADGNPGEIIGQAGVVPVEAKGPEIELGYRLGRAHWGRGYATEAALACANYATDPMGPLRLDRLIAVAYPENIASRNVLTKAGFAELGESDRYYSVPCSLYELVRSPIG
jgi:RimJ/RimL family protein N-acetyltransferase